MPWYPDDVQRLVALDDCVTSSWPSRNGRGSDAWARSWTHLHADRRSAAYCRVTFENLPANAVTAASAGELEELVELIEQDADLNVVVFGSADPGVFIGGHDPGPAGPVAWGESLLRLARAPAVSVAAVRGRVGRAGRELALACDLRVGSRDDVGLALDRLLPDDRLDDAIEAIAARLETLDRDAVARVKARADPVLPPDF